MEPSESDINMEIDVRSLSGSSSHFHSVLPIMDSNKTNRTLFFGRLFNDKQATLSVVSAGSSDPDHTLPEVVPQARQQPESKWKKIEKARRFMIDILGKSAPCLLGDSRNLYDDVEPDVDMDFSPEPFYEECAALMVPRAPSKDMACFKEILLPKPAVIQGPLGRSCSWQFYTPPNTSVLSSPAPGCFTGVEEDDYPSIIISDNSLFKKTSRWSFDSEDSVFPQQLLPGVTLTKPAQAHSDKSMNSSPVMHSVRSTIPFPTFKDLSVVECEGVSTTVDNVVSPDTCGSPREFLSPSGSTSSSSRISDEAGPSPTTSLSSPSTDSIYSQETAPSIRQECDKQDLDVSPCDPLVENTSTEVTEVSSDEADDFFDAKRNRRAAIYTDCIWVLGALRIAAREEMGTKDSVVSTLSHDSEKETGLGSTRFKDFSVSELSCDLGLTHNDPENGVQPTLLPTHINLRNAASSRKHKDSHRLADYFVHPPGSKYTSPEPQAAEKF